MKIGRNEPCLCGSGKKYKKCCFGLDDAIKHVIDGWDIELSLAELTEENAKIQELD